MDLRIVTAVLAVPGVIGVRFVGCGYDRRLRLVDLGRDAGFPAVQALEEWKGVQTLVEAGAVDDGVAAAVGVVPAVRQLEQLSAEIEEHRRWDAVMPEQETRLDALRLVVRWPWIVVGREAWAVLDGLRVPYWAAGYTRHSDSAMVLRAGRWAMAGRFASVRPLEPGGMLPACDEAPLLWQATWADRVLRALSGGAVTEPGLQFAQWQTGGDVLSSEELVADDIARAGATVARRMSSGACDEVDLPLHGRAVAVRMPAAAVPIQLLPPGAALGDWGSGGETDELVLPAETVWVLAPGG